MPERVLQSVGPCVLHTYHSPITVQNEGHHPFLQSWQKALWGRVLDDRRAPLCATGHNSTHVAIDYWESNKSWPIWCTGKTRDMAEFAFAARAHALNGSTAHLPWPTWMGTPL